MLIHDAIETIFTNNIPINLEFQINKQFQGTGGDFDDYTVIECFVIPDQDIRVVGSAGIDGDIYAYFEIYFNKDGTTLHSRINIGDEEAQKIIVKYYNETLR